jgi:hypothetical protein
MNSPAPLPNEGLSLRYVQLPRIVMCSSILPIILLYSLHYPFPALPGITSTLICLYPNLSQAQLWGAHLRHSSLPSPASPPTEYLMEFLVASSLSGVHCSIGPIHCWTGPTTDPSFHHVAGPLSSHFLQCKL